MNNRPFFSIATPCWNSVATIERTIKSVLSQQFKDYEYIIVDGGSTDGTLDIIKRYEPLFEGRMKWKSERDKGLYDAFNKGVERSTGRYCWNVNADDYLELDALEKVYRFVKEKSLDEDTVISGAMNFISTSGTVISLIKCKLELLEYAFKHDYIGLNHPATIVPKAIYNKYGAFDPNFKIIGDADWYHRVYKAGVKFAVIDEAITNMTDGGISNRFIYQKEVKDRVYFLKKNYNSPFERIIRWAKWTKFFYTQKIAHNAKEYIRNNPQTVTARVLSSLIDKRKKRK